MFIVWKCSLFACDECGSSGVVAGVLSACVGLCQKAVNNEPAASSWYSSSHNGCTETLHAGTQTLPVIKVHIRRPPIGLSSTV